MIITVNGPELLADLLADQLRRMFNGVKVLGIDDPLWQIGQILWGWAGFKTRRYYEASPPLLQEPLGDGVTAEDIVNDLMAMIPDSILMEATLHEANKHPVSIIRTVNTARAETFFKEHSTLRVCVADAAHKVGEYDLIRHCTNNNELSQFAQEIAREAIRDPSKW